jgi:hypothetical protein
MEIIRTFLCLALTLGQSLAYTHHGLDTAYPALKVASFNIQAFGRSKTRKPAAMMMLKKV